MSNLRNSPHAILIYVSCAMGATALALAIYAVTAVSGLRHDEAQAQAQAQAESESESESTPSVSTGGIDESLQKDVAFLKRRAELARHADDAISNGYRSALTALRKANATDPDPILQDAANAEINRVHMFYLQSASLLPLKIPFTIDEKVFTVDERLPTKTIAAVLQSEEQAWQYRSRAAQLLGTRPETIAVEALILAVAFDSNLAVVYQATNSFKRLTGCPSSAVFGSSEFDSWYAENKPAVSERLAQLAASEKAPAADAADAPEDDKAKEGAP